MREPERAADFGFDANGGSGPAAWATDFSNSTQLSMLRALVGERLGYGVARQVFAVRGNSKIVLKVEPNTGYFQNVIEYEIWQAVQRHENARWFAPVLGIDQFGTTLIMARTTPITDARMSKVTEVPAFFTDLKTENFGLYKGRVVCHDYGVTNLLNHGVCSKRMRKNNW